MSKKEPTVTMPIAVWDAAEKRIDELEEKIKRLQVDIQVIDRNNDQLREEKQRLRELLQHWYDYGYDRQENERALEEGE